MSNTRTGVSTTDVGVSNTDGCVSTTRVCVSNILENTRELAASELAAQVKEREFFIDNLLVRIHFIIVMIRWTGLAPWEFEFPFPGSLTSTFVPGEGGKARAHGVGCLAGRGEDSAGKCVSNTRADVSH